MSFGKMRDLVTVLPEDADIVNSHTVRHYEPSAVIRGYVKPASGRGLIEAQSAVGALRPVSIIVRCDATAKKHVKERGKLLVKGADGNDIYYKVICVVDIENRHMYLEIVCEAIV